MNGSKICFRNSSLVPVPLSDIVQQLVILLPDCYVFEVGGYLSAGFLGYPGFGDINQSDYIVEQRTDITVHVGKEYALGRVDLVYAADNDGSVNRH